jgi:uncharacterized protein YjbI with pentapeptide repeats
METPLPERKSYTQSCRALQEMGLLDAGHLPPLPKRSPRHDDENLGLHFFRTRLGDAALDGLSLPRTYFGRSEIAGVTFRGTDLSESTANWTDFLNVDFRSADLSRTDLRSSTFASVSFQGAILRAADLRRSRFRACKFQGAEMTGTKLTRSLAWLFRLSRAQRSQVDWQPLGPEPEGG